jgi:hypothetical protein
VNEQRLRYGMKKKEMLTSVQEREQEGVREKRRGVSLSMRD